MATQTGSIDMAAMAEAAKTANDYITDVTSAGIQVHPKGDATSYAAIDADGMSVVRESESVAHFGESTRIGKSGESHMELDYHSMRMIDREGTEYLHISDLRDADGYFTDEFSGNGSTVQFPLSVIPIANTISVTIDGVASTNWYYTTPFLTFTTAPSDGAVILVKYQPSDNSKSLLKAFTYGTRRVSHHIGPYSFAAGHNVSAWSMCSVAFGLRTSANSDYAFAEGCDTKASGIYSHAQNHNTVAAYEAQTAIGMFNANSSANAFEIGNGTADNARSNAFAVGWDGTVTAAGEVKGASVSATVTLASGVSATTRTVKRSGNLVTVYIDGLNLAAELANHGTAVVATVPSGYRPAYAAYAQLSGWNQGGSYVTVGTDGTVTVNNQSGAAIPVARALGFTLAYVM